MSKSPATPDISHNTPPIPPVRAHPRPAVRIDGLPYYIEPPPCVDNLGNTPPLIHPDNQPHYWQEISRREGRSVHDNTPYIEVKSVCIRCGIRKQEITGEPTLYALANHHPGNTDSSCSCCSGGRYP